MFDSTSLPLHEHEKCVDECGFCVDGKCNIHVKRYEKLNEAKYSWIIDRVITFEEPKTSKSGSTRYHSAMCVIHPSSQDIWILKCERLDRTKDEEEWYTVYRLYDEGNCVEFDDMKALNKWLKRHKYDGRKLTEEDLNKHEGE